MSPSTINFCLKNRFVVVPYVKSMTTKSELNYFLKDAKTLSSLPTSNKIKKWILFEYPFDSQLLTLSPLYLKSRIFYLELGGRFYPRICSTMRSLSAQDLFEDSIDYSPSASEFNWFCQNSHDVSDPKLEMDALFRFSEISVFHEQNHRVIWRLLPRAPSEQRDLSRYLNFAESLVVMLDLALGDDLGFKNSTLLENMRIIYRSGSRNAWVKKGTKSNRDYLIALFVATYFLLETMNPEDIYPSLNYIFPGQKKMNWSATQRSLHLSELFTRITNPQWQERYWKQAYTKLKRIHSKSLENTLYLPEDPLDFGEDLFLVHRVLDHFGL